MRLLLLGGSGQVGTEFQALPLPQHVEVVAPDEGALDLTDHGAIDSVIAEGSWSAVINAAAYTDVDRAESEEVKALAINGEAPARLAAATSRLGIPLVHISTDYVFDGRKGAPYVESDAPSPLNAYGRTKLAGEQGVAAGNHRHVIVRTSWVYSPYGRNFVRTILRLASERERLTIVADQRGCPTAAQDVANVCLLLALRCASSPESGPYGLYHFAGGGEATWHEFATTIVELARLPRSIEVAPIRTEDYPTPAKRPIDSRLDCGALDRDFRIKPRAWREALKDTLDRLLANKATP
jgi:dTDP-4-dehydrorhamnose reductase